MFDFLKNAQIPTSFVFIKTKIGSTSEKHGVIYKGLAPSRANDCVNTNVSASKSDQNIAIYSGSCLPRFLEIAKTV